LKERLTHRHGIVFWYCNNSLWSSNANPTQVVLQYCSILNRFRPLTSIEYKHALCIDPKQPELFPCRDSRGVQVTALTGASRIPWRRRNEWKRQIRSGWHF
jgi:hypothetical protein